MLKSKLKLILPALVVLGVSVTAQSAVLFPEPLCFREPEHPPRAVLPTDKLPCEIPAGTKLPRIHIAGEIHSYALQTPHSSEETQARARAAEKFWENIGLRAQVKDVIIAAEGFAAVRNGVAFDRDDIRWVRRLGLNRFPIEDELALAMAGPIHSSRFHLFLNVGDVNPEYLTYMDDRIDNLLLSLADSTYLQKAWKQVARPYANPETEAVARKMDELACAEKPGAFIREWRKSWNKTERRERVRVFEDMYSQMSRINVERNQDRETALWIDQKIQSREYIRSLDIGEFVEKLSRMRDPKMAQNIGLLYCSLLDEGKDIYVQVGSNHAEPILKLLQGLFRGSGLSPKLIQRLEIEDIMAEQRMNKDNTTTAVPKQ